MLRSRSSTTIAIAIAIAALGAERAARADLENQVFSSTKLRVKLVVPHTWRVTEQASYPGFLLWLMRSQPEAKIVVTGETFTRDLFCAWPVACRTSGDPLPARYACAIRDKLAREHVHVGPVQAGPRENEEARFPSVWFEYDDGAHFGRQAIAMAPDNRVVSLVLATPTEAARRAHARAFDQLLRSLESVDAPAPEAGSGSATGSAAPTTPPPINPIGPCS